jgi:hypothetical protein
MVLCWLALPVFAVLAIFSAKYRRLTAESLECLFKTATFRKCSSGLDDRIKSQITGKLLKFSPRSAGFFYKNYKIISLIFLVVFIWSTWVSAVAIYNYVEHGNCNGPEDPNGFCIIDSVVGSEQPNVATNVDLVSCEHGEVVDSVALEEAGDYEPCPCGAED